MILWKKIIKLFLVNYCCYEHDGCYENSMNSPAVLAMCDQQFATCTFEAYQRIGQPSCAYLAYYSHGKLVADLGGFLRNLVGYSTVGKKKK